MTNSVSNTHKKVSMNNTPITPQAIQRWVPTNLGHIVGCEELKNTLLNYLRNDAQCTNLMISGTPGTGKTSSVKAFMQTLICPHASGDMPAPCLRCESCRRFDVRHADVGLFSHCYGRTEAGKSPIHYLPINCGSVTEAEFRDIILDCSQNQRDNIIIFLDEAHRLVRRKMESLLLKPIEELDVLWIACSASIEGLEFMFKRRFKHVSTSHPSIEELVMFLADRCADWKVAVDAPESLILLAQGCKQNTSACIMALAHAAETPGRILSKEIVMKQVSDYNEIAS